MPETFSIKTLFRYTFITSPFIGLFGSIPGFALKEFQLQRTGTIFIFITCFTIFFWLVNILLLWVSRHSMTLKNIAAKALFSSVVAAASVFIILHFLQPILPPPSAWKKMPVPPPNSHPKFILPLTQLLAINIVIFILVELIILKKTRDKVTFENEQLKLVNLEARNNQLRQQLHPHFLFNSLTTLRSLIRRSPDGAEIYLEQLAELLRFSTNKSNQAVVSVNEELELCTNYLNMQRVRFNDALFFSIDVGKSQQLHGYVPVYSVQLLIENAIKHNILTKEQPLYVEIKLSDDNQFIIVKNNLQPKTVNPDPPGIGLANLSERYRMLNEEEIIIEKKDGKFCVTIKILKDAGSYN